MPHGNLPRHRWSSREVRKSMKVRISDTSGRSSMPRLRSFRIYFLFHFDHTILCHNRCVRFILQQQHGSPSQRTPCGDRWDRREWKRALLWGPSSVWRRTGDWQYCPLPADSNCKWWVVGCALWLIVVCCLTAWFINSLTFFLLFYFVFPQSSGAGAEESAIGVYWVTDGIDRCLVGFLPRHCVRHFDQYEGRIAQVVEFLKSWESPSARRRSHLKRGVCMAAFLENKM